MFRCMAKQLTKEKEKLKIKVNVPGSDGRLMPDKSKVLALLGRIHSGLLRWAVEGAAHKPNLIGDVMRKVKDELFLGRRCRKILLARRRKQTGREDKNSARDRQHDSTILQDDL